MLRAIHRISVLAVVVEQVVRGHRKLEVRAQPPAVAQVERGVGGNVPAIEPGDVAQGQVQFVALGSAVAFGGFDVRTFGVTISAGL